MKLKRLKPGTSRHRRYWQNIRRDDKFCPGGFDCMCDKHEGVTAYRHSRVFRNRPGIDIAAEYDEYQDNVVISKDGTSRLDYAYDVESPFQCGDWCPCGSNLNNWMDWLRDQDVYPFGPLKVNFLDFDLFRFQHVKL